MSNPKKNQTNPRIIINKQSYISDGQHAAELRVAEQWLKEIGLNIGDIVSIATRKKLLIMLPVDKIAGKPTNYKEILEALQNNYKEIMQAIQRNLNEAE